MNLRTIGLGGFTVYRDTMRVTLPERGLVLVTGPNGSGKSSLVEGVAWAAWGETLRDETPLHPDAKKAHAQITTYEGLDVRREKHGAGKKLTWGQESDAAVKTYETPTKAQEALEQVIGSFDVWRKTAVLSSHDAAHFTRATDGERKRLLESMFGLERFDTAQERRSKEAKANDAALTRARNDYQVTDSKLESERRRLKEALDTLGMQAPLGDGDLEDQLTKLRALARGADTDIAGARATLRKADSAGGEFLALARTLRVTLDRIKGDKCPTCEQPIAPQHRSRIEREHALADTTRKTQEAVARKEVEGREEQLKELEGERTQLGIKIGALERALSAARADTQRRARLEAIKNEAQEAILSLEDALALHAESITRLKQEERVLDACDTVLGLKGARAHVLGSALGGMEAVANGWLERLSGQKLRLKLKPYTENKDGKSVRDALSLDIDGAGGGYGYKATSGGERRRLDLSILLALAEISSAAHGVRPGTLFADEVFDALDEAGTLYAIDVLEELADERCVVLISHSKELAKRVTPALHLRVDAGVISAVR